MRCMAGTIMPTSTAMMAMTTSNSVNVNAERLLLRLLPMSRSFLIEREVRIRV